jgi:transcriptional regulator with XRE-family HTH domain
MAYRLRAEVLRKAAAAHGDPSVRRIIMRTGLPRSVVQRSLAGQTEPSMSTLLRLREVYGIPLDELVLEDDSEQEADEPIACSN